MILQEKNYIGKQKKKYLIQSMIWTILVLGIFITGLCLTGTRSNLFTVMACLLAIVASLFITRFISFNRYKDGDEERAKLLESMQGNYHIYHSSIIPCLQGTAYFEHMIVTAKRIYFIAYTKEQVEKYRTHVEEVLGARGISSKDLCFLVASDSKQMDHHKKRIEKEITTSRQLDVEEKKSHQAESEKSPIEDTLEAYSNKASEILM
ncbi:MAG: hypothetical protein E7231_03910 [Cellulosilyticum sp.]|nr:hypothetical protein [Cellulosilyticum sp.]